MEKNSHDHEHSHTHDHEHTHCHDHKHSHGDVEHEHEHCHVHNHEHNHQHIHEHSHSEGKDHEHMHKHHNQDVCEHAHQHEHIDGHDHEHTHGDLECTCTCSDEKTANKDEKILKVLLSHWVDHNKSHEEGFNEWIEKTRAMGKNETANSIEKAVEFMEKANEMLIEAGKNI